MAHQFHDLPLDRRQIAIEMYGLPVNLLVSDGLDWIHAGSFLCGEISEAYSDDGAYDEADHDAPQRYACGESEEQ